MQMVVFVTARVCYAFISMFTKYKTYYLPPFFSLRTLHPTLRPCLPEYFYSPPHILSGSEQIWVYSERNLVGILDW